MTRYVALILRLRLETAGSRPAAVRVVGGSLQEAGSERVVYFSSLDEVLAILAQTAAQAEPPGPGEEEC